MEVRRPPARAVFGRDRWRYAVVAVLVASAFARFGAAAGLGIVAVAAFTIGGVAVHATRARLRAAPDAIELRRFVVWRRAELEPGSRLVRVLPPGPSLHAAEARAAYVVLDDERRRRLRWTGRWTAAPEEIARAAGIAYEDLGDSRAGRAALPFHLRHPGVTGTVAAIAIVVVAALGIARVLRDRDRDRDRDAAAMRAALAAHAERAAWDVTDVDVERQGSGPYSNSPDEGVIVLVRVREGRPRRVLEDLCLDSLRVLRDAPLEVQSVTVGPDRFHGVNCDPRGFFFD